MSDKITNVELLRSIGKLEAKMDKIEGKIERTEDRVDSFKYWALGIIVSIFVAATFIKLPIS